MLPIQCLASSLRLFLLYLVTAIVCIIPIHTNIRILYHSIGMIEDDYGNI